MKARNKVCNRIHDLPVCSCAKDSIDFRQLIVNLSGITLSKTSRDDQTAGFAMRLFVVSEIKDRADRLLFGRFDESAGVHDQDIGILRTHNNLQAGITQHLAHAFGIDQVFRTPQR